MQYCDFKGCKVSALGMGCMRLPVIDGADDKVDEPAAKRMIDYAMEQGVTYYDTAWGYHGGHSEEVVGRCLAGYPRDSFSLASKFPGYDVANFGKVEQIFTRQLEKCQVDYFDFYLCHNVCELNIEQYLDDEHYHTVSYLAGEREAGRIRHLGFSVHGDFDTFMRFLDCYGEQMEFCQIQLNWMDWGFQEARRKVEVCRDRGLPVVVMEPLRGGALVDLAEPYRQRLAALRPDAAPVEWALDYLMGIPEVMTVLTGASNFEQLKQNIAIFNDPRPTTAAENQELYAIAADMKSSIGVPCTACHYCTSHCPQELDIPGLLRLYNQNLSTKGFDFIAPMAVDAMAPEKKPTACIACRACEQVCPQQIKISEVLADFSSRLGLK